MAGERSSSEPPQEDSKGLRGGFPIKINGYALGSQENLAEGCREGRENSCDRWGPRVRSRQSSVTPSESSDGGTAGGRRLSTRGTTPVRLCGGSGPMSSGATSDELDFAAPFGPTATPVRGRKSFGGQQQQGSQQRSLSQNRDIFSGQNQSQSQSRDIFSGQNQSQNQNQSRDIFSSQNQSQSQTRDIFSGQSQNQSQNQGREEGLFSQQSSSSNQSSSYNSSSHQQIFSSSSQVEQSSSFSSGQYQQTCGQSASSQSQELVEERGNVTSMNSFESVQSVSSEQRQSSKVESSQSSEVLKSEATFSSADQKSSAEKLSSDGQIGSTVGDVGSPYNLPPQVSARSLISELEAPPSPLLIKNNNVGINNSNTTTSSGGATPWAPATTSPEIRPELSLSTPPSQPLNLGTPLGGLEQPSTNSPTSSSSGFQLQRPRQFQPSPATARRILPPSPASQSPQSPQKASPAPQKVSPAAPTRNSPSTSSSSDLAVQFGQQKEVKFNSVSCDQRGRVHSNKDESKSGAASSRDSKSKSKEAQSGQLAHAICNMTETLASFKADVQLVDREQAEHVDAALQTMKESLQVLREPSQPSTSLDDVIGNMKDTLKAIRNDVNHKTLKDLNREMTPFDLPALSPVPQKAVERRPSTYSVGEEMKKDRIEAVSIREETRQDSVSEKTVVVQHKMSTCSQSGADLFADSRDGSVRRDSLRSVRTTREEEEEKECDGGSRVMPNMPGHLGRERGQGRTEESRKLSPARLRHDPQIPGNSKEENNEEDEEEEEEEEEEGQHIEHNVEARVVVQLDRSATKIGTNVWSMETGATPFMETGATPFMEAGATPFMETGATPFMETGATPLMETAATPLQESNAFQDELADLGIRRPSSPLPPSASSSSYTSSSITSSSTSTQPSSYPSTQPSPSSSPSNFSSSSSAAITSSSISSNSSSGAPLAPYSASYLPPAPSSASSSLSSSSTSSSLMPPTQLVGHQQTYSSAQEVTQEISRQANSGRQSFEGQQISRQSFEGQQISKSCVQELQKKLENQETGSVSQLSAVSMSQETMSQLNVSSEKSLTMQETVEMTNVQETKVFQETHQETHLSQQSEKVEEMQASQETQEVQRECSEAAWTSSQSESSTCERSSSSTMSLTERFAVDSQQRYASTQETLRRDERREEAADVEITKKKKVGEGGCILGKHMKVIKAAMEELEGSQKMEEQLDPSDTEHLHRRQVSEQPSLLVEPSTSSYTTTAKESDEETVMTTTTFKDTDWESTTFKETDEGDTTAKETEDEGDETETEDEETVSMRKKMGAVFLTECSSSQDDKEVWRKKKRRRNRTIDYSDLPSTLVYECSVKDYHEKKYEGGEEKEGEKVNVDRVEVAKDGLGLILERLHNIESKLDDLKHMETSILGPEQTVTRRHSLPTLSLPRLGSVSPVKQLHFTFDKKKEVEKVVEKEEEVVGGLDQEGEESSNCSTPTMMEPRARINGYETDDTQIEDSDCEEPHQSYRPFPMDLNIEEMSSDEDLETRQRRIENLASSMKVSGPTTAKVVRRPEMNMEIDTLSERSEEEGEREEPRPRVRRMSSGRKRSMSRERQVAKIRYCWRCHHAGHENWQCQEDVQPGGWCPRCLESTHWEDACWVEAAHVLCPICSIPGHLPCVHQATDFRQRKLVIDTFGWLAFREWFQDLTFRSWWNCSGYTGVPLYKIMQRNPTQDLDLGFEEQ